MIFFPQILQNWRKLYHIFPLIYAKFCLNFPHYCDFLCFFPPFFPRLFLFSPFSFFFTFSFICEQTTILTPLLRVICNMKISSSVILGIEVCLIERHPLYPPRFVDLTPEYCYCYQESKYRLKWQKWIEVDAMIKRRGEIFQFKMFNANL